MKVVLVNQPYREAIIVPDMAGGLGFEGGEDVLLPPLDLAFLAASLLKEDFEVKLRDPQAEKIDEDGVLAFLKTENPDAVILSLSLPTFSADAGFASRVKEEGFKRVYVRTFITFPDLQQEFLTLSKADGLLFGELENSLADILRGKEIKGTAFLKDLEFVRIQGDVIPEPDALPLPARELLPNDKYAYNLLGRPVTTLQTSRGCPFPCSFYCPYPLVQGKKWRPMSPERILAELKEIKKLGIDKLFFRDATFTLDKERIVKLCELITRNELEFSWWCESRANCLDQELLEKMAKAGLKGINLGVETGDERSLKERAKEGVKIQDFLSLSKICRELKIKLHLLLMLGIPGEDRRSLYKTYQLLKRLKPHSIGITYLTPYPGTPLYQMAEKKGWIESKDYSLYQGHSPVMRTDELTTAELKIANSFFWRGFHLYRQKSLIFKLAEFLNRLKFLLWSRKR